MAVNVMMWIGERIVMAEKSASHEADITKDKESERGNG